MSDLTEFLLARIAEDEGTCGNGCTCGYLLGPNDPRCDHRVLADCEVKRSLVGVMTAPDGLTEASAVRVATIARQVVLTHLALPYADHPDYREEWKP